MLSPGCTKYRVTHSPITQATVAGLRGSLARPTIKKEPITVEMLKRIAASTAAVPITLTAYGPAATKQWVWLTCVMGVAMGSCKSGGCGLQYSCCVVDL